MTTFRHERLEAYRLAREFAGLTHAVRESLPRRSAIAHEMETESYRPMLAIARGSVEMTRRDAVWSFRVARRSVFVMRRMLRWVREDKKGDQASATAAIEISERLHDQLTRDIETLKQGGKPWSRPRPFG